MDLDIFGRIGEQARDAFDAAKQALHDFLAGFKGEGDLDTAFEPFVRAGERAKQILDDLISGAKQLFAGFTGTADADGLITPVERLGEVARSVFDFIKDHIVGIGEIVAGAFAAEKLAGFINGIGKAVSALNPLKTELAKLVGKTINIAVSGVQTAIGLVQSLIDKVGGLRDRTVNVKVQPEGGEDAGQSIVDRILGIIKSAAPAIAGAISGWFAAGGGAAIAEGIAALGASIGAALLALVSSPVIIGAAIAVGAAAVTALIVAFREPIAEFFTSTLPGLIGEGLGLLSAALLELFIGLPIQITQGLVTLGEAAVSALAEFGPRIAEAIAGWFADLPGKIAGFFTDLPGRIVGFFEGLPERIGTIVDAVARFFEELPGKIGGFLSDLPSKVVGFFEDMGRGIADFFDKLGLDTLAGEAMDKLVEGFRKGFEIVNDLTGGQLGEIVDFFKELPGKIKDALGDVGSLLVDAGKEIIGGLLKGLKDKFGDVTDFVGGIAKKIADLKGPLRKDRILLIPAGKEIMGGLDFGLRKGFGGVEDSVSTMAGRIERGMTLRPSVQAALSSTGGGAAALPRGDTYVTHNHVAVSGVTPGDARVVGARISQELERRRRSRG
jgi:phage-related protein